jgi:hypothetical protein
LGDFPRIKLAIRHHEEMETRESPGQAYRDGELIASEIVLTETARLESTPVPITGTNRMDFKRTLIHGQSTIKFIQVDDPKLEDELRQLIAAAGNVDLRRRQRDERWGTQPIDLILDYERNVSGCQLTHPLFGHSGIDATDFPIHLPDDRR